MIRHWLVRLLVWARRAIAHPFARWVGYGIVLTAILWATTQSLTTIGQLLGEKKRLEVDLKSTQLQVAAVLRTNAQLADSNAVLARATSQLQTRVGTMARSAETIEAKAGTIRAERGTKPPLRGTTASDSSAFYRDALASAEREAALLRDALEQRWQELAARDSLHRLQRQQLALLTSGRDSAIAQLRRTQPLLARADDVVRHSEPRCRIARVVPCPSRTVAFVGGAVVTVVAYTAIQQVH